MGFRLLSCHRAPFDPFPIFLLVIIVVIIIFAFLIIIIIIIDIVSIIIVIIVNIIIVRSGLDYPCATKFNLLYQIRIGVTIFESIHNFQKLHIYIAISWQ